MSHITIPVKFDLNSDYTGLNEVIDGLSYKFSTTNPVNGDLLKHVIEIFCIDPFMDNLQLHFFLFLLLVKPLYDVFIKP